MDVAHWLSLSYVLNSLQGVIQGIMQGTIIGLIKRDAKNLDPSSFAISKGGQDGMWIRSVSCLRHASEAAISATSCQHTVL